VSQVSRKESKQIGKGREQRQIRVVRIRLTSRHKNIQHNSILALAVINRCFPFVARGATHMHQCIPSGCSTDSFQNSRFAPIQGVTFLGSRLWMLRPVGWVQGCKNTFVQALQRYPPIKKWCVIAKMENWIQQHKYGRKNFFVRRTKWHL